MRRVEAAIACIVCLVVACTTRLRTPTQPSRTADAATPSDLASSIGTSAADASTADAMLEGAGPRRSPVCHEPLAAYCHDFPATPYDRRLCGTYDEALGRLRSIAKDMCPNHRATLEMGDAFVQMATCGNLRVLDWNGLVGGARAYFGSDGALITVEASSDVGRACEGTLLSFETTYGEPPLCPMSRAQSLCP